MSRLTSPVIRFLRQYGYQSLLVAIFLIAIFFRFYKLNHLPPGLHPDEAANGLDIFRMIENHDFRPLYATNGPREALFFYLQAIFVLIMGNTITALRVAPAIIGTLGVGATFLWARSWFGRRVAVLAAFMMAVNPWAVTLSRDGFRASMTPLFVALAMWLFTKAVQTKSRKWWLLSGFWVGLGMYTYLSYRLFPFALIFMLGYLYFFRRAFIKPYLRLIGLSLIAFAVALLPMGIFAIHHAGDVFARAAGTSFLNKDLNGGHPLQTLGTDLVKTALMFNVHGDENYRHNLGGQPELNFFVGLMFLIGIVIALSHIWRPKYLAVLAVFGVMIMAEALTAEGIPHALRAIGVIPSVFILAGIGVSYVLDIWYQTFPINSAARASGMAMMLIPLTATLYQGYNQYFVAWAKSPETYQAYSEDAVAIANYLNSTANQGERPVMIDGYSDKTVYYITHKHSSYRRIEPSDVDSLSPDTKEIVIVNGYKDDALKKLKVKFPKARLIAHRSEFSGNELFSVYEPTP